MDILYHYCSTESFHAIIQSQSIWLSSLSLSNDTMEGKVVASVIGRLAEKDSLDQPSIRSLQDMTNYIEQHIDGLGFCLSEDGDLLSQWRGYAANATGVAIGFSTKYLHWLAETSKSDSESIITVQQVVYDPAAQELLLAPTYRRIKQYIGDGAFKVPGGLSILAASRTPEEREEQNKAIKEARLKLSFEMLLSIFPVLFRLKADAFREEVEWRLLSHLVKSADSCSHRVMGSRIVPCRQVQIVDLDRSPIAKVILGPKHDTPTKVIEDFLKQNQFVDVQVERSTASYR